MGLFDYHYQRRQQKNLLRCCNMKQPFNTARVSLCLVWAAFLVTASLIDRCSGSQVPQTARTSSLRGNMRNEDIGVDAEQPVQQNQSPVLDESSGRHPNRVKRRQNTINVQSMTVDLTLSISYVDLVTANLLASPDPTNDAVSRRFCESVNEQAGGPQTTASATEDSLTLFVSRYDPFDNAPSCVILETKFILSDTDPDLGASHFAVEVSVAQTVLVASEESSIPITVEQIKAHVEEGFSQDNGGHSRFISKLKRTSPEAIPGFDHVDDVHVLEDGPRASEERPKVVPPPVPTSSKTDHPPTSASVPHDIFANSKAPIDPSTVSRSAEDAFVNDQNKSDAAEKQSLSSIQNNPAGESVNNNNGSGNTDLRPVVIAGVSGAAAAILVAVIFSVYFLRRKTREMNKRKASGNRSTSQLIQPPPTRSRKHKDKQKLLATRDGVAKHKTSSPRGKNRDRQREGLVPPGRHPLDIPPPVPSVVDVCDDVGSIDQSTLDDGTAGRGKLRPPLTSMDSYTYSYSNSVRKPGKEEMLGTTPNPAPLRGPNLASFLAGGSVQLSDMDLGQSGRLSTGFGTATLGGEQENSIDMGYSLEAAIKEETETNSIVVASGSDDSSSEEDEEEIDEEENEKERMNDSEEGYSTEPTSMETDGDNDNTDENDKSNDAGDAKYDSDRLKAILRKNFSNLGFSVDYEDELLFPSSSADSSRQEGSAREEAPKMEGAIFAEKSSPNKQLGVAGAGPDEEEQFSPPASDDGSDWKSLPKDVKDGWKSLVSQDTPVTGSDSRKRPIDAWGMDTPPLSAPAPVSPTKSKVDPNSVEFKPDVISPSVMMVKITPSPTRSNRGGRGDGDDKKGRESTLPHGRLYVSGNPRGLENVSSTSGDHDHPYGPETAVSPPSVRSAKTAPELGNMQRARVGLGDITNTAGRSVTKWDEKSAKTAASDPLPSLTPPSSTQQEGKIQSVQYVPQLSPAGIVAQTGPLDCDHSKVATSVVAPDSSDSERSQMGSSSEVNEEVTGPIREKGVVSPVGTRPNQSKEVDQHGVVAAGGLDANSMNTTRLSSTLLEKYENRGLDGSGLPDPPLSAEPVEKDETNNEEEEDDDDDPSSSVGMVNPWLFDGVGKADLESTGGRRQKGIKGAADSLGSGDRKPNRSRGSDVNQSMASNLVRLETQLNMLNSKDSELRRSSASNPSCGSSVAGSTVTSSSRSSAKSHASSKYSVGRVRLDVIAPPGKLGVILANRSEGYGTVVSDVRVTSVLTGKVLPGDRIVAIDGNDVSALPVSKITEIMGEKANAQRVLTIITPSSGGRGREGVEVK